MAPHLPKNTMRFTEQINIDTTPKQVWPFLADPVLQAAWNSKIILISRPHEGLVITDETYGMTNTHSNTQRETEVHVVEVIDAQQLTFEYRSVKADSALVVIDTFTLTPTDSGTRVEQTIDLSKSAFPWPVRLLVRFVMKFGKRTNASQFIGLKQMVESEQA